MALRDIVTIPDPLLRQVSKPIEAVGQEVKKIAADLLETMYEAPGIGLAAVQVGVPKRLLVIDTARDNEPRSPLVLINPEILWSSSEVQDYEEGCLSIPDFYEMVARPKSVRVRYIDRSGEARERMCENILATVVQHEIDHLNGVLFIDYISKLKRDRVIKKFTKLARADKLGA
jgi:peptide deformylase